MQFEVSVALNFVIAYLYNKLPRRRVNMLGEEIEKHLRMKFQGHWYPERPTKGSAYRSLRISKEKVDKVLVNAAVDCGLDLQEILDALPNDLTIWIDPGEVSYRIGEKGVVKILYEDERRLIRKNHHDTNKDSLNSESSSDSEERDGSTFNKGSSISIKPFNLDAQVFRPIIDDDNIIQTSISSLINLSPSSPPTVFGSILASSSGSSSSGSSMNSSNNINSKYSRSSNNLLLPTVSSPTIGSINNNNTTTLTTNNRAFVNKTPSTPMFISPATFAQTKFGSLKSKHASKKCQRMVPSEFSAYIKQKEQLQRIIQVQASPTNEFSSSFIDSNNLMTPNSSLNTSFLHQPAPLQQNTTTLLKSNHPINSQLSPTIIQPHHQLSISTQNSFSMQHQPVFNNKTNNSFFTPHNVMTSASSPIFSRSSSMFGAQTPFANCNNSGSNGIAALPRPNSLSLKSVPSPSPTSTMMTNNLFGNNSGGSSQESSFSPISLPSPSENSNKNTLNSTKGQYALTPFVLAN